MRPELQYLLHNSGKAVPNPCFPLFKSILLRVDPIIPEEESARANFVEHWQLSLDLNQPAALREHHRSQALFWGSVLSTLLGAR